MNHQMIRIEAKDVNGPAWDELLKFHDSYDLSPSEIESLQALWRLDLAFDITWPSWGTAGESWMWPKMIWSRSGPVDLANFEKYENLYSFVQNFIDELLQKEADEKSVAPNPTLSHPSPLSLDEEYWKK